MGLSGGAAGGRTNALMGSLPKRDEETSSLQPR